MEDRRFFGMTGLALLSGFTVLIHQPTAAVFPSLMLFVLGFDGVVAAIAPRFDQLSQGRRK